MLLFCTTKNPSGRGVEGVCTLKVLHFVDNFLENERLLLAALATLFFLLQHVLFERKAPQKLCRQLLENERLLLASIENLFFFFFATARSF